MIMEPLNREELKVIAEYVYNDGFQRQEILHLRNKSYKAVKDTKDDFMTCKNCDIEELCEINNKNLALCHKVGKHENRQPLYHFEEIKK